MCLLSLAYRMDNVEIPRTVVYFVRLAQHSRRGDLFMKRAACLLSVIAIAALPLSAYEYPLTDTAIREAYFRGAKNDERTHRFLKQYEHVLPMPKSGPHVATVALETPYGQIVRYTATALNFTAVDAVDKFAKAPARIRVRVQIDLTASYTAIISSDAAGTHLRSPDFWRDFKITLIQAGQAIPERHLIGEPLYIDGADGDGSSLSGAVVTLDYSAERITSDSATVEVRTPDGQEVRSDFDLARLQ